jgi:GDPmannose 4,6-dehydratase
MKRAIITGITGQDGFYLTEFLKAKGYEIHGLSRRIVDSANQNYIHHQVDLGDSWRLQNIIDHIQPDEIYNLGAMSNERQSYEIPEYTINIDGLGVLRLLESMRIKCPKARLFQASTSELFGKAIQKPQNEDTPFYPRSPYGVAKLHAYWSIVNYREAYNLYACNGILFNHESPLRDKAFVTRKIVQAVVRIHKGLQDKLVLGNLNIQKDWGFAKDYVEAMWLMLQREIPEDFVLATGKLTSVRNFVEMAFKAVDITIAWVGTGLNEKGYNAETNQVCVEISPQFYRPDEGTPLIGDPSMALKKLKWSAKTKIEKLIGLMIEQEIQKKHPE